MNTQRATARHLDSSGSRVKSAGKCPVKTGLHCTVPAGAPGRGEEEAALASPGGAPGGGSQLPSCGGEAQSLGYRRSREQQHQAGTSPRLFQHLPGAPGGNLLQQA